MAKKHQRDSSEREPLHEPPQSDAAAIADIDRILARLDAEIPEAQKRMDELLARLRTSRIAA
jgi:hypothetical protein